MHIWIYTWQAWAHRTAVLQWNHIVSSHNPPKRITPPHMIYDIATWNLLRSFKYPLTLTSIVVHLGISWTIFWDRQPCEWSKNSACLWRCNAKAVGFAAVLGNDQCLTYQPKKMKGSPPTRPIPPSKKSRWKITIYFVIFLFHNDMHSWQFCKRDLLWNSSRDPYSKVVNVTNPTKKDIKRSRIQITWSWTFWGVTF